ncbi:MAG TPA: hypothetical protein H9904_10205 [Candidatus Mediterraneibacter guildfordensis]|nr:hypothetical protein [Candidatus Mediterraneibacter guildfordensis]
MTKDTTWTDREMISGDRDTISGDRDTISGEGRGCEPCGEEKYAGSG